MTSTLVSSRGPKASDWAKMKPYIAELYKVRQLPLKAVMKEIEDKYAFIAKEADYRTRIRRWGAADASWKKNGSSDVSEAIATTLLRYAQSGYEIELYRWGELLPEREVHRIKNQSHVPLLKLFNASPPELPKGYVLRPQLKDRVEDLTIDLPFLTLERCIYERFTPICPTPMLGSTDMLELRDYIRVQRGLPLLQVSNEALYERLMSKTSALRSILPCTEGRIGDTGSDSIPSMRMGVHMSDLHRHLLCALGNNLAGLGNISGQQLYHLLRMVSDEHVIVKLLSEGGHLRLPITQQLLRACIEVGNASMVDTILSMRMLQVHINELTCEVDGEPYTALERASMLRNKALVDVMLRHGAD
ncbi:hypothetical protein BKA58DRAFT_295358, partial [Alternaria rosae]|uniref:uncharacterized protein n=1 Tax=Alternaria rosae TaxID=1187941 RepID=UPI001E8DF600